MSLKDLKIDNTWTLFLDRDGVINVKRDNDYVKKVEEFIFLPGAISAISNFTRLFHKIVIVTNQQGVGKGIMTHEDLRKVHDFMEQGLAEEGGKLDAIYYCPELAAKNAPCRKPNIGMALQAQSDFPEIDFDRSILVGDSISDIEMGKKAGMKTIFIHAELENPAAANWVVRSLKELNDSLKNN